MIGICQVEPKRVILLCRVRSLENEKEAREVFKNAENNRLNFLEESKQKILPFSENREEIPMESTSKRFEFDI